MDPYLLQQTVTLEKIEVEEKKIIKIEEIMIITFLRFMNEKFGSVGIIFSKLNIIISNFYYF